MAESKTETAVFRVVRLVPVVTYREQVLLETDDWLEAEAKVIDSMPRMRSADQQLPHIIGMHPTHDFIDGNCSSCGAYANGSYRSHAPCGTDFTQALHGMVEEWREQSNSPAESGGPSDA